MAAIDRQVEGIKELKLAGGRDPSQEGHDRTAEADCGVEGKIAMGVKENHMALKVSETILFMRLVDGEFPEYKRVIPEGNPVKAAIARDEFLKSLRRASVLVDEKARAVKVLFSKGKMVIESSNPSYGIAKGESAMRI